jgi:hypothetical protein
MLALPTQKPTLNRDSKNLVETIGSGFAPLRSERPKVI